MVSFDGRRQNVDEHRKGKLMRFAIRLVILLGLAPCLTAQNRATEPGLDAATRDMVAKYAAAREISDVKAIGALFTDDADQLVSSGEWRKGRDALVRGMIESSKQNSGARTLTVETVRQLAPGVGIADARYEIAGAAGAAARKMWSTFLVVRTPAGWRIAAIRNMLPGK
jgi:uncharacterized protein (TIGR02246 family)